jgi:hypothetical protein
MAAVFGMFGPQHPATATVTVTCIKNYIYNYTTPCKMIIYDGDGMSGSSTLH